MPKGKRKYRKRSWAIPDGGVDVGFLGRAYIHPTPSRLWPARLPALNAVGFGPVRVLNPEGTCVKVISVATLLKRPLLPWNPAEPGRKKPKRSTVRKYGYPEGNP